ncbi:MAG: hypothetical protein ACRCUY_14040 [Thermoguttaceae bacterium]
MTTRLLLLSVFVFVSVFISVESADFSVVAQEFPNSPQTGEGFAGIPPRVPPGINPVALMRFRDQLTMELQRIQQTIGFVDPADRQLLSTLQDQQADLIAQLKDINSKLKEQGMPLDAENGNAAGIAPNFMPPKNPNFQLPPQISSMPRPVDPTLTPGGIPQQPFDAPQWGNKGAAIPPSPFPMSPQMSPGMSPGMSPQMSPEMMHQMTDNNAISPWASPTPPKELIALKETVEGFRKEVAEMKETIKALETQIQLLNRNILLNQPK